MTARSRGARAFPWPSLDVTSRTENAMMAAARGWARTHLRLEALTEAFAQTVGRSLDLKWRRLQGLHSARSFGEGFGCIVEDASARTHEPKIIIQLETALTVAIVASALRLPVPKVTRLGASSPPLAGAVAAILASVARRAYGQAPLRVTAVGSATDVERAAVPAAQWVALSLTAIVDDDAYSARLLMPGDLATSVAPAPWGRLQLASLGSLPLDLCVVVAAPWLGAHELGALREGDALVIGASELVRIETSGRWRGPALLAPSTATTGLSATLDETHLVLGGEVRPLDAAEADMTKSHDNEALVEALGDVPVVVRVEIGEVRMAAREWAALGKGDVISLGARIGERVVLRAGGVPIARGDLVDVEGEIGVRIAERIADASAQ
jgi:type III secretion system YscQ/HrcQ family protein